MSIWNLGEVSQWKCKGRAILRGCPRVTFSSTASTGAESAFALQLNSEMRPAIASSTVVHGTGRDGAVLVNSLLNCHCLSINVAFIGTHFQSRVSESIAIQHLGDAAHPFSSLFSALHSSTIQTCAPSPKHLFLHLLLSALLPDPDATRSSTVSSLSHRKPLPPTAAPRPALPSLFRLSRWRPFAPAKRCGLASSTRVESSFH